MRDAVKPIRPGPGFDRVNVGLPAGTKRKTRDAQYGLQLGSRAHSASQTRVNALLALRPGHGERFGQTNVVKKNTTTICLLTSAYVPYLFSLPSSSRGAS